MIHSENIQFEYPQGKKFSFPNLSLEEQAQLLILGNSGCGKTTWLHLLAGILSPTSGKLSLNGEEYPKHQLDSFRGKNIGIIFQESHFISALNVRENIMLPWSFQPNRKDLRHYDNLVKQLGIQDILYNKITSISTGQQQRVSIARALINKPNLILADEPTSNLDDKNCMNVINLLKEISIANKCSLVIVTHDNRLKSEFKHQLTL